MKFPFLAKAYKEDAIRFNSGNAMQQQAGSGLAFHVAATQDIAEKLRCRLVNNLRRCRQLSSLEYTDDNTSAALLFWASAFYAKFQSALLKGDGDLVKLSCFGHIL